MQSRVSCLHRLLAWPLPHGLALVLLVLGAGLGHAASENPAPQVELLNQRIATLEAQAMQERLQRLELHLQDADKAQKDQQDKQQSALLEIQRKSVDWWLTAIGLMLTVLGAVVALVGFWLPREARARIKADRADLDAMRKDAREAIATLRKHEQAADDAAAGAKADAEEIKTLRHTLESYEPVAPDNKSLHPNAKALADALKLQASPLANDADRLRAKAILASEKDGAEISFVLAENAYSLWAALAELNASDHGARFKAGYWAHILRDIATGEEKNRWFNKCAHQYAEALRIKPDKHEAANNWGNALNEQAQAEAAAGALDTARALWSEAAEKYALALAIKPGESAAATNWGNALGKQAWAEADAGAVSTARALWSQAAEKYALALKIEPDKHESTFNWGNSLDEQAQAQADAGDMDAARALWSEAVEKYALALKIKPEAYEAAYNYGIALDAQAQAEAADGALDTARGLWSQAAEKYALALKIKPDKHEAANNWGNALGAQAQAEAAAGALDTARGLWSQAAEKYALALKIKPDEYNPEYNWGSDLGAQAEAEAAAGALDTARSLWSQAAEKFALSLKIKPDAYDVANKWGAALGTQARAEAAAGALEAARVQWSHSADMFALALDIKPDMHNAADNWGITLLAQSRAEARAGDLAAASHLLDKAQSLFTNQLSQYPNAAPRLAYSWACLHGLQGHAAACVAQLEIARAGNTLPDKEHLQKDKDLERVRHSPEFTDWWKRHFGDDPA